VSNDLLSSMPSPMGLFRLSGKRRCIFAYHVLLEIYRSNSLRFIGQTANQIFVLFVWVGRHSLSYALGYP